MASENQKNGQNKTPFYFRNRRELFDYFSSAFNLLAASFRLDLLSPDLTDATRRPEHAICLGRDIIPIAGQVVTQCEDISHLSFAGLHLPFVDEWAVVKGSFFNDCMAFGTRDGKGVADRYNRRRWLRIVCGIWADGWR